MTKGDERRRVRARPHSQPGPFRAWTLMLWRRMTRPPVRRWRALKLRILARRSIERAGRWRGRSGWGWMWLALQSVLAVAFVLWVGRAVYGLAAGADSSLPGDPAGACEANSFNCGVVAGVLTPVAALAFSYVVFFFVWRTWRFHRPYRNHARRQPRELVQTAGTIVGDVVGRDDLCRAIMEDLRDPRIRRPHVVVGGVGTGKTALLVQLTRMLAGRRAVPVPVRLRDADRDLDFKTLAFERFCERADALRIPGTERDRIWQQLCGDNKIVVLADGLEEALQQTPLHERDNLLRVAIHRAHEGGLPLVIASRPHQPLRGMEASMTELEPLSERVALEHLLSRGPTEDSARLRWIVETAEVAESPLYLQITDELHQRDLLHGIAPRQDDDRLDTRGLDRVALRLRLIDTWVKALEHGYLHEEVALSDGSREAVVEQLSAMACVGLGIDSLYVKFSDFPPSQDDAPEEGTEERRRYDALRSRYGAIRVELEQRLRRRHWRVDLQHAATLGQQLGLVEPYRDGVRFPHSIMQAYLGSRFMETAVQTEEYLDSALKEPGRELLLALVMSSRPRTISLTDKRREPPAPDHVVRRLRRAARERSVGTGQEPDASAAAVLDAKTLELYTAAAQVIPETTEATLADMVEEIWTLLLTTHRRPELAHGDARTLEEAKLQLVRGLGAAMRRMADDETLGRGARQGERRRSDLRQAYREFLLLGCCESSYPVRLAAAQEIGAGGDLAYEALRDFLGPTPTRDILGDILVSPPGTPDAQRTGSEPPTTRPSEGMGEVAPSVPSPVGASGPGEAMQATVPKPRLGLSSQADTDGTGPDGGEPGRAERRQAERERETAERQEHEQRLRSQVMRAWLAPLLAGSVSEAPSRRAAQDQLQGWLDVVSDRDANRRSATANAIQVEIALAQGFKAAANRRRWNRNAQQNARGYLAEQAKEMLHRVGFWHARMSLLHALTLWSLPDGSDHETEHDGSRQMSDVLVRQWLVMRDDEMERTPGKRLAEHPFVSAAAKLCVLALESRQPERFLWIDESGVVSKIGSGPAATAEPPRRDIWIPPSTGWSSLDPRAQQLVADVLLLLNLAEGDRTPKEREARLARTDRPTLPSCLTGDRSPLDPEQTVGIVRRPDLRSRCASDCPFDLCPYPLKGEQSPRAEFSESFCRRQRLLLRLARGQIRGLRLRRTAPWQGQTPGHLRTFWGQMGERSRR